MPLRGRAALTGYRELVGVLVAAVVGLTLRSPLAWLVRHQGIDTLLAVLVFSTAITLDPKSLARLPELRRPLVTALVVGVSVLPALSWLAARVVQGGALRDGVMTVGLAPCEIASVATTAMAGGSVVLAGGVLIGSTILAMAEAGPIMAVEAHHASVHPFQVITTLLVAVAAPLGVALLIRTRAALGARLNSIATATSTLSVAALVALIAAEVHLGQAYLRVAGALLAFLLASIGCGWLLGRRAPPHSAGALLLTISMRDFAIAASLAASAFGPAAAAPLGLYGIMVLTWGTGCAGYLRARGSSGEAP